MLKSVIVIRYVVLVAIVTDESGLALMSDIETDSQVEAFYRVRRAARE